MAVATEVNDVLRALRSDSSAFLASIQAALPSDADVLTAAQGPSLLTLKNAAMLNYIQMLVALCSTKLRQRSQDGRKDDEDRLVRNLIEMRLVLEKIRPVEGRMRGLVERLIRAAEDENKRIQQGALLGASDEDGEGLGDVDRAADTDVDPLAFRPNLSALSQAVAGDSKAAGKETKRASSSSKGASSSEVYRPPRLAPVAYNPEAVSSRKSSSKERIAPRNAALLSDLSASMSNNPYETSSGGVGVGAGSGSSSSRAKALARMQQYEEENFTRLIMNKRDAKRRRRDEEDVALGGAGKGNSRGRVGAGLEEEFGDLLRNSGELRSVKRDSALQRSKRGRIDDSIPGLDGPSGRGGGRNAFQQKKRNDQRRRK